MLEPEQQLVAATEAGIENQRLLVQPGLFSQQQCERAASVRIFRLVLPVSEIAPGLALAIERHFRQIVKFGHRSGRSGSAGFPRYGSAQMFRHHDRRINRSLEQGNFFRHIGAA